VVIAVILALKFGKGEELSKGVSTVLVVAICLFVVAYGWSWGPLGWLVPSELFPLEMRSAGQSVVVCVNLLWTAAVAQIWMLFDRHRYWKRIVRRDPKYQQGNLHQQQQEMSSRA
jgi:MFS transporter, SP family, sugar:H+ symporter